ncbi:ABC transporter ATP-binding protein [Actinokineospora sp. NBRC 105648]|uniref:ABC transporter ATP-binding protein n=1 Tax=Actinokineospora sp. NBRC 105648 TaxID=3032206 RepID=UPI0024A32EB5|nr:ABC transporter ATP-binding protein [Actinokineospora sp. NBRC 105648]GLZ36482.1 ABC transporter ATP-binding protein [Actinokineospora sp. NBRC 105648]
MTEVLARASGVTRRYGDVVAVDELSLEIPAGQMLGLLGPNGAGKSTLINMFVGLRKPSAGSVELFGHNPRDVRARRRMGMTPQETGMPETLQAGEVIEFVASHYPNPIGRKELLEQFHLEEVEKRQTGGLSGGEKRRLAIALAFVGRPDLVFLDEPTTGLDVEVRRALWDGVKAYNAAGGTAVITSHYLEEIEELAERVVIIDSGKLVADDSVASLRRVSGLRKVTVRTPEVPTLPGVVGVEQDGDRVSLITPDSDQLVRDLVASGVAFSELEVRPGSLEDAFLAYTAKAPTTASSV